MAHAGLGREEVPAGRTSPLFFGSAHNNSGVELLLNGLLDFSGGTLPMKSAKGEILLDSNSFISTFTFSRDITLPA